MSYSIGFIGCGNMGGALATAVGRQSTNTMLYLCDADTKKASALANTIGGRACDLATLAENADMIYLGVKPQGFEGLFQALAPMLKERETPPVLLSMAAGVSIAAVEAYANVACPVIRIMPNTPAAVGEGMILYCTNALVSEEQKGIFCASLSFAGRLDAIDEEKIDAASALSGCGPAFVYLFAEALADGAVACGLARDKANLYAAQTLIGAATLLLESGKHPGKLKDEVCSPGGTTIQGVRALEENGFRTAAMEAVIAAYQKTLELKK